MKNGHLEPMRYMPVGTQFVYRYPDGTLQLQTIFAIGGLDDKGEPIIARWVAGEFVQGNPAGLPVVDLIFDPEQYALGEKYPYILSFAD